jgi:hypothetical protein
MTLFIDTLRENVRLYKQSLVKEQQELIRKVCSPPPIRENLESVSRQGDERFYVADYDELAECKCKTFEEFKARFIEVFGRAFDDSLPYYFINHGGTQVSVYLSWEDAKK